MTTRVLGGSSNTAPKQVEGKSKGGLGETDEGYHISSQAHRDSTMHHLRIAGARLLLTQGKLKSTCHHWATMEPRMCQLLTLTVCRPTVIRLPALPHMHTKQRHAGNVLQDEPLQSKCSQPCISKMSPSRQQLMLGRCMCAMPHSPTALCKPLEAVPWRPTPDVHA